MIVSVTRLRLRSVVYLPGFFYYAIASQRELTRAQGFVDGRLIPEAKMVFWTITRWQSEAEMRAWRGAGAHGKSMAKLAGWCDEAQAARFEWEGEFPDWRECYGRLKATARFTPVHRPSADQSAKVIPEPDFGREQRSMRFSRKAG